MDFAWTSNGGVLLDGTGDLAFSSPTDSLYDMIRTRLKTDLDGWKLYRIGAGLKSLIGQVNDAEVQTEVSRRINASLSNQLLPPGALIVKIVPLGPIIQAYVYVNQALVSSVSINKQDGVFRVN